MLIIDLLNLSGQVRPNPACYLWDEARINHYFTGNRHPQEGAGSRSYVHSKSTASLISDFHSKITIKHQFIGLGHRNVVTTFCTSARLLCYRARHIVRHRVNCFYSGVYLTPYLQHSILRIHLRVHCGTNHPSCASIFLHQGLLCFTVVEYKSLSLEHCILLHNPTYLGFGIHKVALIQS